MVLSCSVHGCINTPRKDKTISFHRFPKNPSVLTEWLIAIGRPTLKPTFERICSEHFHHDDFMANSGRRTLKCNAIPSIFEMTTEYVEMPVYTNSSRLNTTVGQQETAIPSECCDEVNTWQDNKNFKQSLHRMYSSQEDALEHNYSMNTIPKTELDEAANEETTCSFVGCGEPNVDDVKVEIEEFQDSSTDTVPTTAHFFRNESSETGATIKVEEQRSIPSFVGCEEPNADDFKVEIEEFQDSSTDTVSKTAHFFRNESSETGEAIKVEERRAIPCSCVQSFGVKGSIDIKAEIEGGQDTSSSTDTAEEILAENLSILENTSPGTGTEPIRKRRRRYMGDIEPEDLEDPAKFEPMWYLAEKTVRRQKKTIRDLQQKLRRAQQKIKKLNEVIEKLRTDQQISPDSFKILGV